MIKVLIADDHDMVRHSFTLVLSEIEDINISGEAKTGESAVKLAKQTPPDVVLMDVRMPGIGGLEATKRILAHRPATKVIGLSGYNDGTYPGMFIRAGAMGYITKDVGVDDLVDAIKTVYRGEAYLSKEVAQRVVQMGDSNNNDNPFDTLSERELQIALMLVECYQTHEVSSKLGIATKTVNVYKQRLFEKLDIHSEVELTLLALRHAMIEPENINVSSNKNDDNNVDSQGSNKSDNASE
ncbi:MAG: response regulator [Pseudomonadales bacterium]|nr:response regulator [Pseudomonadales bacterium]